MTFSTFSHIARSRWELNEMNEMQTQMKQQQI